MNTPQAINVRVTQSGIFISLSLDASNLYTVAKRKLDIKKTDFIKDPEVWDISTEVSKQYSVAIVFAQAFLESFIFDYSSEFLGADYFVDYLDKLDTLSKYIIVPELISGKATDRNSTGINWLREIVRYRNDMIHSKSFIGNDIEKAKLEKIINRHKAQGRVTRQLPKALLAILQELYDQHPCDITADYIDRIKSHRQK
ncbi:MAG: hypothetical protein AB7E95_10795 [Kiritimatiellales bacterium]